MITMKLIKKIMTGSCMAVLSVAMYYCLLNGAPRQGTERMFYMILAGIFCVSAWTAVMITIWYIKWLRKKKTELESMVEILLKNADKLDK